MQAFPSVGRAYLGIQIIYQDHNVTSRKFLLDYIQFSIESLIFFWTGIRHWYVTLYCSVTLCILLILDRHLKVSILSEMNSQIMRAHLARLLHHIHVYYVRLPGVQ